MDQLERNKNLVLRAWQAYDAGDEAATLEDVRETMRLQRLAFADKRTTVDRIIAQDDLVVTQTEMLICRLAGDRIAESWQITSGGLVEQLTGRKAGTGDNRA